MTITPLFCLPLGTTLGQLEALKTWTNEIREWIGIWKGNEPTGEFIYLHAYLKEEYFNEFYAEIKTLGGDVLNMREPWTLFAKIPMGVLK